MTVDFTEDQRRELYNAIDFDEKAALAQSFEASRETQKLLINMELIGGSFALNSTTTGGGFTNLLSFSFQTLLAAFMKRTDSHDISFSLGSVSVFDDATPGLIHRQILKVKSPLINVGGAIANELQQSFFQFKFEHNPIDDRADNGLFIRMLPTQIVYHKQIVEAVYRFFNAREGQIESVDMIMVSHSAHVRTSLILFRATLGCCFTNSAFFAGDNARRIRVCPGFARNHRCEAGLELPSHNNTRKVRD